jgi:quinoprotein glucose dehydrogenase
MKTNSTYLLVVFMGIALITALQCKKESDPTESDLGEWAEYLGGGDKNHYSSLTQINADNVKDLKIAWTYSMPDSGQIQANSIIVDGVLYGVTSTVQAFALDAATGKEIWKFGDPLKNWASTSRGVTYWEKGSDKRILYTVGPNLWALDATNGKPILTFADSGKVDLHLGLPESAKDKFIISNTPGILYKDNIIMPVRVAEESDAAPGDIRAFNVITGKLAWTFHTIPYPGEFGYETFPKEAHTNIDVGGANNWAGMAIDRKRGIVYIPTGSASYDFYGGKRTGQNLFSNCILALDAQTGKRLWHYQTTHHDLWDRDLPAPPNLVTINHNGKKIDAVAQVTKQGYVYIFDRVTGTPLFPITEVSVPASNLNGEHAWPTQPIPSKPAPFARQSYMLTEKDVSPYAPDRDTLIARLKNYKTQLYAPPSKEGTVIFPGYDGGAEWGGAAVDPDGIMYVNSNEMAWVLNMVEKPKVDPTAHLPTGERIYINYCASCHGKDLKGNAKSGYPTLININQRRDKAFVSNIITTGKGMMPGSTTLKSAEKQALVEYLFGEEKKEASNDPFFSIKPYLPYGGTGYNKFLDANGLPAITPPWGTLNAIDLNTGEYVWKIPFGETESLKAKGYPTTGSENYGGPVVTATGLLFIAATKDGMFRAYDKKSGKIVWETKLPAAGFATPSTYLVNGKQYIVIACGGTKLGTPKGNKYVAFSLP